MGRVHNVGMLRNVKTAALLGSFVLTLGACEIEFLSDPLADAEVSYDERIVGEWLVVTNVPLEVPLDGEAESSEDADEWHPDEENPATLSVDAEAGLVVISDTVNTQEVTVRFGKVAGMWIATSEDLEDLAEPPEVAEGEETEADPAPVAEVDRRFFILSYRFVDPDFIQLSYADAGHVRERIEDGFTGGTIVPVCLPEDLSNDTPEQTAAQALEDVVSSFYTSADCTVVNLTLEGLADLIETNPDDLFTEMEDSRLRRIY